MTWNDLRDSIDPRLWHSAGTFAWAFVLGTAVGLERQWRQRSAGLRTNVLVALGAAAFGDVGMRMLGPDGATRLLSYVVSGIGFLGAGVILKEGTNIRGLNTAATLWCSAAIGCFCGAGLRPEAAAFTLFVLAAHLLLRPISEAINRRPLQGSTAEAHYRIHAICDISSVPDIRELMTELLNRAHYPLREIETLLEGEDLVELAATLAVSTAEPATLDAVVAALETSGKVRSATWSVSASE
jgi:putative Mg2+ transporter-C (MgtC) family protein